MQKKNSLRGDFCRSRAAEAASEKIWILIEFGHDLQIISHNPGITRLVATFKANR